MPSLKDIKRRIGSVKSTQKITKAMKMVAAAKLRRAQEAILQARPYAMHMKDLVSDLALRTNAKDHPLLRQRDEGTLVLVVVTSDRGLCGGFNHQLVGEVMRLVNEDFAGRAVELVVCGRKGIDILRRRNITIREQFPGFTELPPLQAAQQVLDPLIEEFAENKIGSIHVLFNEFRSAISQKVTLERFLPFEPADTGGVVSAEYVYEPSEDAVFAELLHRHLHIQFHRVISESAASEHGARMTAMDSATNNAGEMINTLTLHYNRARQAAITKELIEVISGSEAL